MDTNAEGIKFVGMSKRMLADLSGKKLTMQEFLLECAYWAMKDGFHQILPMQYPTPPNTAAFNEYVSMLPDKRNRIDPSFFQKNYEINQYYEQRNKIRSINNSNLEWLRDIKIRIPEGDISRHAILDERITLFLAALNESSTMIENVKKIFGGREV